MFEYARIVGTCAACPAVVLVSVIVNGRFTVPGSGAGGHPSLPALVVGDPNEDS
jgi:hypothetical protein